MYEIVHCVNRKFKNRKPTADWYRINLTHDDVVVIYGSRMRLYFVMPKGRILAPDECQQFEDKDAAIFAAEILA